MHFWASWQIGQGDYRKDSRDLSVFQIELRLLDRKLLHALPISVTLCACH